MSPTVYGIFMVSVCLPVDVSCRPGVVYFVSLFSSSFFCFSLVMLHLFMVNYVEIPLSYYVAALCLFVIILCLFVMDFCHVKLVSVTLFYMCTNINDDS